MRRRMRVWDYSVGERENDQHFVEWIVVEGKLYHHPEERDVH